MPFQADAGTLVTLGVGMTTLLVAALVSVLDFNSRVHRAFALVLLITGLLAVTLAFTSTVDDLAGRLRVYLFLAIPFAAAHFAFAYRRRHGRSGGTAVASLWVRPLVLLAAALVVEIAYLLDHDLFIRRTNGVPPVEAGPLSTFTFLPAMAYAAIALVFALDARQERGSRHGKALVLAAAGLALEPLCYSSFRAFDLMFDTLNGTALSSWYPIVESSAYMIALALLATMAVMLWQARGARRLARRVVLPLLGLALASGILCAILFAGVEPGTSAYLNVVVMLQVVRAVWLLFMPLLVTFSLVRYGLFDAEVRLRFAIRGTTLAGTFLAVFFIVNKVTENLVAARFENEGVGIYVGGAVAGLLLFALAPLQRIADRIARSAVPEKGESHITAEQRSQLYREQLEIAWADGRLSTKERLLFARLQERLGIAAEEATKLETDVLQTLSSGTRHRRGRAA